MRIKARNKEENKARNKKGKNHFNHIPDEVLCYLVSFLDVHDLVAMALTSWDMYGKIMDFKLHSMHHNCMDEIAHEWSSYEPFVRSTAKYGYNDHITCTREKICSGNYEARYTWLCHCSIFPWMVHKLKLVYVSNDRDVDILAWYKDDERMCYTML